MNHVARQSNVAHTPLRAMNAVEQKQFDLLCRLRQMHEDGTTCPDLELFEWDIAQLRINLEDAGIPSPDAEILKWHIVLLRLKLEEAGVLARTTPLRAMNAVEQGQFDALCRLRQMYEGGTTRPDAMLFEWSIASLRLKLEDAGVLARR